jgi:hypothetical protein
METSQRFFEWMNNITKTERIDVSIIGFYFGIFETTTGFEMYVAGTISFDEEDEDWATEVGFEPVDKYFTLGEDFQLGKDWEQVLEKVESMLYSYVNSDAFLTSFLKNAEGIATGFDDGNLTIIYRGD